MRPDVLIHLAEGRAKLELRGEEPPYVAYLKPRRMMRLCRELQELRVSFGIPFGDDVPDPPEDGEQWIYFGTLLEDIHVWGRVR